MLEIFKNEDKEEGDSIVVCKSIAKIKLSEPRTHNIDFWWVHHINCIPTTPNTLIFAFYAKTNPLIAALLNSSSFSI